MSASQAIWLIKLKNGGTYMRDNLAIGFPYRSFRTKAQAVEWLKTWPKEGAQPVKVRIKIWELL
jgi:hypothetical protein